jgi:hypothetical protein
MNNRIHELAREAAQYSLLPAEKYDDAWANKFAQLIAEECIGIVENYPSWYGDYRDQIENAFRGHLIAKMKYHFGVES